VTIVRRTYGTGHGYKVNGRKFAGVTTIIREGMAKAALNQWYANTAASYAVDHWAELSGVMVSERIKAIAGAANEDRDSAARKGTKVHQLAEQLALGWEPEIPEELAGHVAAYRLFLERYQPDPIASELVLANRRVRYCGTADLVTHLLGQIWLLEIKTARSGIFRESALQACAYQHAEAYTILGEDSDGLEHPMAELGIERCGALHVRSDGYDLRPLDTGEECWGYFKRLAWQYHADEPHDRELPRRWVGVAVEPPPAPAEPVRAVS
jgi:hypothetical protein